MKLLAIDLSTNCGWSVLNDGQLLSYGKITVKPSGEYPYSFVDAANEMASKLLAIANQHHPDMVVVEETNRGKARFSQKLLEFLHFALASSLRGHFSLQYIDTREWRSLSNVSLNNSEREAKVNFKAAKRKALADMVALADQFFSAVKVEMLSKAIGKRQIKKVEKEYRSTLRAFAKEALSHKSVRDSGGARLRDVSKKDSAVRIVNQMFNASFEKDAHDICDSILIGVGYYRRVKEA